MNTDGSFVSYVMYASPVVKLVLLILVAASIMSWTFILQKVMFLKKVKASLARFEKDVWQANDLGAFYEKKRKQLTAHT